MNGEASFLETGDAIYSVSSVVGHLLLEFWNLAYNLLGIVETLKFQGIFIIWC